jgi:hypothetical protein
MAVGGALFLLALIATSSSLQRPQATSEELPVRLVRVKPADAEMRRLVLDGVRRSSTFRVLVDDLHAFNVIVAIQFGLCGNGRIRSCVSSVDGDDRQRHIRIKVNTRTTDDRLIATIAHELQHALEIARDPTVTDAQQALALYRRIAMGKCREGLSEQCETEAALLVEKHVNAELSDAPPRK